MSEPAPQLHGNPRPSTGGGGRPPHDKSTFSPDILTKQAVQALSDAPDGVFRLRDRAIILVSYGAALRVSEAVGLTFGGLSRDRGWIRFWRPKTGDWHEVPLIPQAWAALEAYAAWRRARERVTTFGPFDPVFVSRTGKQLEESAVRRLVKRAGRNAGLPLDKCHPHTLRHSRITHMRRDGASWWILQEMAGHASISTTLLYTHVDNEEVEAAALASEL